MRKDPSRPGAGRGHMLVGYTLFTLLVMVAVIGSALVQMQVIASLRFPAGFLG